MIDDEIERLGPAFQLKATARRRVLPIAYYAGQEAGEPFEYRLESSRMIRADGRR
jgi:hypothetical protein